MTALGIGAAPTLSMRKDLEKAIRALCAALMLAAPVAAQDDEQRQLDADPRMFAVLTAINMVGYDDGLGTRGDSLVRQAVRQALADFDGESLKLLRTAYEDVRLDDPAANLSQFVSYALTCEPPPTLELRAELPTDLPPEIRSLRSMGTLFERFYREAGIEDLWYKYQPAFEQEMLRIQDAIAPMLFRTAGYLRLSNQSREFAGFRVWVDLMGAPSSLNTRLYGGEVQVVVHPNDEIPVDEIRHAFLIHLLDRLSIRYREEVGKKEVLSRFALFAPALDDQYKQDFELLVTKSLVKAVEVRLDRARPEAKQERIDRALREGYILTPYFHQALAGYEADVRDINKYYPDLIAGIDLKTEAARLQDVTFAERTERPDRAQPAPVKLSETDKALQRAEFLLDQEMLDEARQAFASAQNHAEGRNAQAAYGLARVAIMEADPELAREHFLDAAYLAEDDPHLRAMAYIYIGRIEDIVGNREEAVRNYRLALESGDTDERTRELAEAGIAAPFRRPRNEPAEEAEP